MTDKEKAKAYDEALERVKSWAKGEHPECFSEAQKAAEFIFPELKEKESEDERIRRYLMSHFSRYLSDEVFLGGITMGMIVNWLEKQGEQKPSDKVEPKFHEGDWVVQEGIGIYKIIEVCESWYEVIDTKDNHYSIGFDKECMCHLWTIQDAKDGDVLTNQNGCVLIFKDNQTCLCYTDYRGQFRAKSNRWFFSSGAILRPATKEQRDLLFAKMKEAGYEFDFDMKELKKMEQKPAEYAEIRPQKGNYYMCIKDYQFCKYDCVTFEKGKLYKSEKDGELTDADGEEWSFGDAKGFFRIATHEEIASIQKPKQEWSEKDEETEREIIEYLKELYDNDRFDLDELNYKEQWLKSLRHQNQWKPSDEQMVSIEHAVKYMKESPIYDSELVSLFNDLKKLKD